MALLGPGAAGDPDRPWLSQAQLDAEAATATDLPAPVVVDVPKKDVKEHKPAHDNNGNENDQ